MTSREVKVFGGTPINYRIDLNDGGVDALNKKRSRRCAYAEASGREEPEQEYK